MGFTRAKCPQCGRFASEATKAFSRARTNARSYCVTLRSIKFLTAFAAQPAVQS